MVHVMLVPMIPCTFTLVLSVVRVQFLDVELSRYVAQVLLLLLLLLLLLRFRNKNWADKFRAEAAEAVHTFLWRCALLHVSLCDYCGVPAKESFC